MQPNNDPFDVAGLVKQTQQMQDQVQVMQQRLLAAEATGTAGDGLVSVTLAARGAVRQVSIDPSLLDRARHQLLEDLVAEAFTRAGEEMRKVTEEQLTPFTQQLSALKSLGGLADRLR